MLLMCRILCFQGQVQLPGYVCCAVQQREYDVEAQDNTCTVTDVNSETRPGQYSHAVHHDTSGACGFCDEHESKLVLGWPSVSTDAAVVVVGCARTAKVPCLLGEVAER